MGKRKQPSAQIENLRQRVAHLEEEVDSGRQRNADLSKSIVKLKDVQKLSETIGASLDLHHILDALMKLSRRVIQYENGGVFLISEGSDDMEVALVVHRSDGFEAQVRRQWDEGILRWVMAEQRAMVLPDAAQGVEEAERNFVIVPLFVRGKNVGVFELVCDKSAETFTNRDIELISILANQAAIALENARLIQSLDETNRRLRASQQQVIQAGKMAAVGELAAGIGHEINNPLQVIMSRVQLMQVACKEDRVLSGLEIVEEHTERISRIVRNLMEFARESSAEGEMRALEVHELVARSRSLVSHAFASKQIEVIVDIPKTLSPVRGRPGPLEQVFVNLLLNACQAMDYEGTLTIAGKEEQGFIALTFADTGVGIPSEILPRIFEPFFTTKEVQEGRGLGLSISYGIVQDHGGGIHAISEAGKGTTVSVRLPVFRSG
jgi:C4-dicarboxylate-specific signal transduction histidine kinase